MEIHACLGNEVAAFNFTPEDYEQLAAMLPDHTLVAHDTHAQFLADAGAAGMLLTWEFKADWYPACTNLEAILTPAAGDDWVEPDPQGAIPVIHGTFHGPILAESLLHAILHMNHRIPQMLQNFQARQWDRDIQQDCQLLANQTIMIIGVGNIGAHCAHYLAPLCGRVIGIRRNPAGTPVDGIEIHSAEAFESLLPEADHIVTLLPDTPGTDRILDGTRLLMCKPGAYIYNFGRGNAIATVDLLAARHHIGGAFLDVTDEEPLPATSPLWDTDNIFITPHSSCVYRDYKRLFMEEVVARLQERDQ